jgi:hypothetical protein
MTAPASGGIEQAYLADARRRLADSYQRIRHCLDQLDDAQLWWRPLPAMNSVANLVLHVSGNLRQWLVSGVGGAPDLRNRPQEFAERGPLPREELHQRLDSAVREADDVLARLTAAELLQPRRIQALDKTVLSAISSSLDHLAGHAQEIVYATRLQLGDAYRFAWEPATPEQGATAVAEPPPEVVEATDQIFEEGPAVPEPEALEPPALVPEDGAPEPEAPPGAPAPPVGDYVREIQREFEEEEDEGKL